ncbi:glycosyltransferase family 4 protein [bacterium]|nr:glycosyltransferase family 4 protein [bacterium]
MSDNNMEDDNQVKMPLNGDSTRWPCSVALVVCALNPGGTQAVVLGLGRYLKSCRCQVDVITVEEPGVWSDRGEEFGLRIIDLGGKGKSQFERACRFIAFMRNSNYDVVFTNNVPSAHAALGGIPDKILVVPILHATDGANADLATANNAAWNVVVGVSPAAEQEARLRAPNKSVICITNGINWPSDVSRREKHLSSPIELIWIGRMVQKHKNIFALPAIVYECRQIGIDCHLTIIGWGEDGDELKRLVDQYEVSDLVTFTGLLEPDETRHRLGDSHVLLFPSVSEGLGMVLLESIAAGCVPIVSRLPGVTDIVVKDGVNGFLCDPKSAIAFAQAIGELKNNPDLWLTMSKNSVAMYNEEYTVEAMGRSYTNLIRKGLSGGYPLCKRRSRMPSIDVSVFAKFSGWPKLATAVISRLISCAAMFCAKKYRTEMKQV